MQASQWHPLITRNGSRKGRCWHCNEYGHEKKNCDKLDVKFAKPDGVRKRHNKKRSGVKNRIATNAALLIETDAPAKSKQPTGGNTTIF